MKSSILTCITAYHYQIVSLVLFFIGLIGIIFSKNFIKIFISLEFLVNAINLLFVSFASYRSESVYLGYTISIYTTAISALILAIGLYFTYMVYKSFGTVDVTKIYEKYKESEKC